MDRYGNIDSRSHAASHACDDLSCITVLPLHVYAAAGGTRARMGMHVPTADVT
jgi:hypothetical protein